MYTKILALSAVTFVVLVTFIATSIANAEQGFANQFKNFIEQQPTEKSDPKIDNAVSLFYNRINYQPIWFDNDFEHPAQHLNEYNNIIIEHARFNGLDEDKYDLSKAVAQAEKKTSRPS
jgi:predicted PurR-regulated permease PerM